MGQRVPCHNERACPRIWRRRPAPVVAQAVHPARIACGGAGQTRDEPRHGAWLGCCRRRSVSTRPRRARPARARSPARSSTSRRSSTCTSSRAPCCRRHPGWPHRSRHLQSGATSPVSGRHRYCGGSRTVSITWMIPFEASISALTTVAPLILTPDDASILSIPPWTVAASVSLTTSPELTLPATTW